jgi:hypothetical protein
MTRSHRLASGLFKPSECRSGTRRTAFQPSSLLFQPALEFPTARYMEALQQIASI